MVLSSTAVEPSVYGLGGSGGIPSANNVVMTYPMAASASLSRGDWVKLASATAGTFACLYDCTVYVNVTNNNFTLAQTLQTITINNTNSIEI